MTAANRDQVSQLATVAASSICVGRTSLGTVEVNTGMSGHHVNGEDMGSFPRRITVDR